MDSSPLRRQWLRGDLLAGVTVAAYLVPQVMAYAEVPGLLAAAELWRLDKNSATQPIRSCAILPQSAACGRCREPACAALPAGGGNKGSRHHRDARERSDHQLTRGPEDRVRDEGKRNGVQSELHRDPCDGRVHEGLGYGQCRNHAPGQQIGTQLSTVAPSEPGGRGHPAADLAATSDRATPVGGAAAHP